MTAQIAPAKVPLTRAIFSGVIGLCEVPRGEPFPAELCRPAPKPVLAVIGDDDHQSTGPAGFPAAKRFCCYWAKAAIAHGAAGLLEHYRDAVRATLVMRQVVVIETDAAHIAEWSRLLSDGSRIPILEILPRHGAHPVPPDRARLQ
jgi:hypothetical protein